MDNIQTDVSTGALITAIQANLCDLFRLLSRADPAEHYENGKFTRWHTPIPHPWFNGVLSSDPPTVDDDPFIDETVQYFRDKGVPAFTWWMEPHLKRSDWEPVLFRHGFGLTDDTPGMAVDLQAINESMPLPDGFEVRVVKDEDTLRTWANIFVNGYGLPAGWESNVFDLWMKFGLELPTHNYLGYLNNRPVSASTVFKGGGVAGIYNVATLPEARGKGLGTAMTLKPLQDARAAGYRIGILQPSDMGFNIYKKLGFRQLCQIENFYLSLE